MLNRESAQWLSGRRHDHDSNSGGDNGGDRDSVSPDSDNRPQQPLRHTHHTHHTRHDASLHLHERRRGHLAGRGPSSLRRPPPLLEAREGPLWAEEWGSAEVRRKHCTALRAALDALGVARLVVGHTVQPQINAACDGLVWRVDVLSAGGSRVQVLKIVTSSGGEEEAAAPASATLEATLAGGGRGGGRGRGRGDGGGSDAVEVLDG